MPCSANCATGVHACFGATSGTSSRSRATCGFSSAGSAAGELWRTWSSPAGTSSRSRASASSRDRPGAKRKLSSADASAGHDVLRDPALDAHGAQRPRGRRARRARRRAARAPRPGQDRRRARGSRYARSTAAPSARSRRGSRRAPGGCRGSRRGGCSPSARARRRARRPPSTPLAKTPGSGLSVDRHLLAREEEVPRRELPRARARASPRRRPSCRSRRARAPRRRRSVRGCSPAPEPCRRCPASTIGAPVAVERSPRRRRRAPGRGGAQRTSSMRLALGRLSEGDVDELERAGGEVGSRHGKRHNDARMAVKQPDRSSAAEPERGLVLAVLPPGVDADDEIAELEELARTAGVEPVAQARPAPPAPRPAHVRRQGEARGAEGDVRGTRRRRCCSSTTSSARRSSARSRTSSRRASSTGRSSSSTSSPSTPSAPRASSRSSSRSSSTTCRGCAGMWQHLERLGGGVGTRGPGESQLETDRRLARRRISLLKEPPQGPQPPARRAPQGAAPHRDADGRARRLHERRQVDAPQRAHRRRRLGPRPALRDARPDDARLRARRAPLPRDRHRRLRPPPAALSSSRASPRRSRRRSSPISCSTSSTASASEERLVEQIAAVDAVLHEIGADELPRSSSSTRSTPSTTSAGAVSRTAIRRRCRSRRSTVKGSTSCARGSPSASPSASSSSGSSSRTHEARKLNELYALGTPIEEREDTADGVMVVARLPRRELPRFASLSRRESRRARPYQAALRRLRATLPVRAYAGDAGLDLAACRARRARRRGRARSSGQGSRSRSPKATPASSSRVLGSRPSTGSRSSTRPGSSTAAIAASSRSSSSTRTRARDVRRRARDADRAARRRAGRDAAAGRGDGAPGHRARRERLRQLVGLMALEPRIRVSALLRWEGRILLCRHEKAGRGEYWLLPGGGVNGGESLVEALRRELSEEVGVGEDLTFEGPDRRRRLDRAEAPLRRKARRPHHLRCRPLRTLAREGDGRPTSQFAATGSSTPPSSTTSRSIRRCSASSSAGSRATRPHISERSGRPRTSRRGFALSRPTPHAPPSRAGRAAARTAPHRRPCDARAPARAASRRATGCAAAAGRGDTCR